MKPLVIYHANCQDGFAAAWCFHHVDPSGYDFHPGVYGEPPPDVIGRDVFLVDFSYPRAVVEQMLLDASTVTILDHHKTAAEELGSLAGLRGNIRTDCSGAMMAWKYLFARPAPALLAHIEDRDLWRFALPGTKEITATVFSYPYDFVVWDMLMAVDVGGLMLDGRAILRKQAKDIAELLAATRRRMTIAGHDVPVANLPYTMASDAGHIMAAGEPFAATYYDTAKHRVFSLRSAPDGLDVADIAKQFGGGGHRHSAGFRVGRDQLIFDSIPV